MMIINDEKYQIEIDPETKEERIDGYYFQCPPITSGIYAGYIDHGLYFWKENRNSQQ